MVRSISSFRSVSGQIHLALALAALFGALPAVAQFQERERQIVGEISGSFFSAAAGAGAPPAVIDKYVDLFAARVDFRRDLQPGDTFVIKYSTEDGQPAITAASLFLGGKMLAAVRPAGSREYFDEKGQLIGQRFLRYPIKFTRISSLFSQDRLHPVLSRRRAHLGVDFSAPVGTPVRAVADGVVTFAGYERDGGLNIHIAHGSHYATCYLHLSKFAAKIKKGMPVLRGQIIGAVGMTGLTTGPHLHFGLFERGKYVNPLTAMMKLDRGSGGKRFSAQVAQLINGLLNQHRAFQLADRGDAMGVLAR